MDSSISYTNNCQGDCETCDTFSKVSCDRCDSTLAGERHRAVEWHGKEWFVGMKSYDVEICVDCLKAIS